MAAFAVVRTGRANVHNSGKMPFICAKISWCTGTNGCSPWQEAPQVNYSWHKEPTPYSCFKSGYHWLHFMVLWPHNRGGSKETSTSCATHGLQISAKLYWHSPSFNYSYFSHSFLVAMSPSENMVIRTLLRISAVKKMMFLWQNTVRWWDFLNLCIFPS